MLLYNHQQKFIGIDEEGLRLLNYSSLDELLNVCSDVADLFANEPGYIHNFKHFGWIDFLLHADSDASSAIVHANGRVFSCQLVVHKLYLCDNPSQSGYSIEMVHIKTISGEDAKPHIITPKTHIQEFKVPQPIAVPESALPDYSHITPTKLSEPSVLDIPDAVLSPFDEIDDFTHAPEVQKVDKTLAESPVKKQPETLPETEIQPPVPASGRYSASEKEYLSHHRVDNRYIYDPNVAATELGLPVDLIEEFIGDFIQQSFDFKEDLFEAVAKNDFNNLHILSHKLKGVAANLRIEDALETLSIVNSSPDIAEIEANLKYYFEIVVKLSGKEMPQEEVAHATPDPIVSAPRDKQPVAIAAETPDDIYSFGLKQYDDEPLIVHEEEIASSDELYVAPKQEKIEFKKELLDLNTLDIQEQPISMKPIAESRPENSFSFHYDAQKIAKELGMEKSFFDEILFDYKNDARLISNQITQAIIAFDTHTWKEAATKLKGISDNLRLNEISEELAILSKTNDAQEAKKASARLNSYLDQL